MAKTTVACYGAIGSYSWEAMKEYFADTSYEYTMYNRFEETVAAVAGGEKDFGVLPIENSSTGGITDVYDLIMKYNCSVAGEKIIRIEHNLMALPESSLEDIDTVYSHPQGFAQSREFFKKHEGWKEIPYFSTAKSAEKVRNDGKKNEAAVASKKAAEIYNLKILASHIETNPDNYTRFFIISKKPLSYEGKDKITIILTVKHEPGALYHVLGHFFYNDMNMTHLESRPIPGRPFEYFFHIDVMGNLNDPGVKRTLEKLKRQCGYFRILGNYKAEEREVSHETGTHR